MALSALLLLAAAATLVGARAVHPSLNSRLPAPAPPPPAQQNICGLNATIGSAVVGALNLSFPGLEAVAAAAGRGDLNTACEALADYYRTGNSSAWLRGPTPRPGTGMAGGVVDEMVLHDIFYLSGVDITAKIPRNADGGIDWLNKGPRNDVEFMNCLNRHDSFSYLLGAWLGTGNPIYTNYFNALVLDWVLHLPCPDALAHGSACVPAGLPGTECSWEAEARTPQTCNTGTMESPWRSLEMGIRMSGVWPSAFFGFQNASEFSTSARVLFVLAVSEHNAALTVDGGHPGVGIPNWEMTQWQGLVTSAVSFPELRNSSDFLAIALKELSGLIDSGVYPDGIETEQASGYDMVTAADFFGTLQQLQHAGSQQPPPPQSFVDRVEAMWTYGAYVSDPIGCLPRNGDSDLCGNGYSAGVAAYFGRGDWTYVHTNGAQGTVPPQLETQGPSYVFPWAGQIVLRSGYDVNATWIWFDVGPYGSSLHAHNDKLQLMLHARGSMLLVDSGRFAYAGTDLSNTLHTQYGRNTSAHNTLTIDTCNQQAQPPVATEPILNSTFSLSPFHDTAFGSMSLYDGLAGEATHTRGLFYQRPASGARSSGSGDDGDWLVVVDVVETDRPRSIQAYWHTHPNATGVSVNSSSLIGAAGGVRALTGRPTAAQVCIFPAPTNASVAGSASWSKAGLVRGQYFDAKEGIPWQGWYSQSYDDAWPSTVLMYEASISNTESSSAYFAWLIVPFGDGSSAGPCDQMPSTNIRLLSASSTSVTVEVSLAGVTTGQVVQVPV